MKSRILWTAGVGLGLAALPYVGRKLATSVLVHAPNHTDSPTCVEAPPGVESLTIDVGDIELAAFRMRAEGEPRGTILVLHGIRDEKSTMLGLGEHLRDEGYDAVLVDLRGHGCSGGRFLTYGVRDGEDLSAVLDAIEPRGPVGVYGPSYGGAAGLSLAARDDRVRAVVVVSTFSSLRDVVPDYLRFYGGALEGLVPGAFIDSVIAEGSDWAGVDLAAADSVSAVERTSAAVLVLHGAQDARIPPRHGRALHQAAAEGEFELIEGTHDTVMRTARVRMATDSWFRRWLGGSNDLP